jgi:hypothetical protein
VAIGLLSWWVDPVGCGRYPQVGDPLHNGTICGNKVNVVPISSALNLDPPNVLAPCHVFTGQRPFADRRTPHQEDARLQRREHALKQAGVRHRAITSVIQV